MLTTHPDVHAQVVWVEVRESRVAGAGDQLLVAPHCGEFVARYDASPIDN